MNYSNIKKAYKRASNIKHKWYDEFIPCWALKFLFKKIAFVENLKMLSAPMDDVDYLADLVIADMWATSINKWADNNLMSAAPFYIRQTCKEYIKFLPMNPLKL